MPKSFQIRIPQKDSVDELECPNCSAILLLSDLELEDEYSDEFYVCCPECDSDLDIILEDGEDAQFAVREEIDNEVSEEMEPIAEGTNCINHKTVVALVQCKLCRSAICTTCDFSFSGNIHVCPQCIINQRKELSPRDKEKLIKSFAAAGVATLFLTWTLTISADNEVIAGFLLLFALIASVIGISYSSAINKKSVDDTIWIWVAHIWNYLILGIYLIFFIVGLFA